MKAITKFFDKLVHLIKKNSILESKLKIQKKLKRKRIELKKEKILINKSVQLNDLRLFKNECFEIIPKNS